MDQKSKKTEERFAQYLEQLTAALGHGDRREPCRGYLTGLLLPGERKSVEPLAARLDPRRTRARHQSLHHFVAQAPWDERVLLRAARDYALAAVWGDGTQVAWAVDDTGLPKQGKASVGVARQYSGTLGKVANCQVVVSAEYVADEPASSTPLHWPVSARLYLPEKWAED